MRISERLVEYLSAHSTANIPAFGVFSLHDIGAQFDPETKKLLPPTKKVQFRSDYLLQDTDFAEFVAQKEQSGLSEVNFEIDKATKYWKQKLAAGEELTIEGLGTFFQGDTLNFEGERIEKATPDYYGLEEVVLGDIKKSTTVQHENTSVTEKDYRLNRSILWIFLLIIPVAGMIYLGIAQRERLFGKKSFDDLSVKNSTHRIAKDSVKVDSAQIKVADSLKADSLTKIAPVPVAAKKTNFAAKKKNYRKYPKKKWKKPRKRVNRTR